VGSATSISSVTVTSAGNGYTATDILTFAGSSFGGSSNATFSVTAANIASADVSSGDALVNYTTLWYLTSGSGTWTSPTSYTAAANPFTVNAGSLQSLGNGTYYYTIGQSSAYPNTWYSYQTGVWSNFQNWTSDPSGTTLINGLNLPPQPGDAIVILNGITITNDVGGQVISTTTINSGGTLDMSNTTGNTLGTVSGAGLLRIGGAVASTMSLPTGNYAGIVTSGTGGTIEYYNTTSSTYNLPSQATYNNLKLSTSTSTVTFVEVNDLTVNGNFNITSSSTGTVTWQINDNTNANRTITIAGDLTVSSNGKITAGTGNSGSATQHGLTLKGNFTNNGIVQFFDPTDATYSNANYTSGAVYTSGLRGNAVGVFFTDVTNKNLNCNNQTDFYNLTLNKGTGQQTLLIVNSTSNSNFRLFGPANIGSSSSNGADGSTTTSFNALSIVNGTLELTGTLTIPLLTTGNTCTTAPGNTSCASDFGIPQSGGLWLNGSGVNVTTTDGNVANNDQRILVDGLLRITNGTLSTGFSKGVTSGASGTLLVEGGTLNTWQIRATTSGTQNFSYIQTGGTVNVGITGIISTGVVAPGDQYARFAIPSSTSSFQMSGGVLNIGNPSPNTTTPTAGGIDIQSAASNYNVTGGTINAYIPTVTNDFGIRSTAPLYNLNIYSEGTAGGFVALLSRDLTVLNNLTLVTGNSPTFNCNNNNLTIGGNFSINNGTTFTPGVGTVTFNGSGTQTWAYGDSPSATSPAITSLNAVTVNKSAGTLSLSFLNTTFTTLPATNVLPSIATLTLTSGTFNDGGSTVTCTSSLTNNATHTSTGSGNITANGPTSIGGNNGVFGNLSITTNGNVATSGTQTVTGNLRLINASSTLNIGSNALTVSGNIYSNASTGVAFTSSKRILTSGLHNAGGLTRQGVLGDLLFPVGSSAVGSNATVAYSPITINATATTQGTITVRPVNSEHPNVTASNQSLVYYWRVSSSGFSGLSSVTHKTYTFSTATKNGTLTSYKSARYDRSANSWGTNNTTYDATGTTTIPNFNTGSGWTGVAGDQLDGEYTCGNGSAFGTVVTYYSTASGPWNVNSTWSTIAVGGAAASSNPTSCSNCPVVIGNGTTINHKVTIDANSRTCGSLALNTGSALDCSTFTSLNFGTNTGGTVTGRGWLRIASATFPAGDFTNFLGSNGGTVEWYGSTATIPSTGPSPQSLSLNTYYDLVINPSAANTITLPATNLTIYDKLTQGDPTYGSYTGTALTNGARTVAITSDFSVLNGTFNFSNATGASTTMTVGGSITNNGILSVVAGGPLNNNSISIVGGIANGGTMNFKNTGVVNLTFTGTSNVAFSGSGATTLNLVTVNKGTSQIPAVTCSLSGTLSTPSVALGWLTLTNGTFDFEYTGISSPITLSSSTYTIPSTSKLKVGSGTVQITSATGNDLFLNGALEVAQLDATHAGTVYTNSTTATSAGNDIEYGAAGSPTITISGSSPGGTLTVDGSIRRSISSLTGALVYNQTGGTVTVGGSGSDNTRGVFEIDSNTGSSFTLTGSTSALTVQRQTGGSSYADLFLNPATSNTSSTSTITVGLGTVATNTGMQINIAPTIGNLVIAGGANAQTVKVYSNALILGGSLTVTSPSSLDTNPLSSSTGQNVFIAGNLNLAGSASYLGGANTTTFNGTGAQTATFTGSPTAFKNMTINNSGGGTVTLQSGTPPTLTNLNILAGTLDVGSFALNVNGDITNNSSQIASANGGTGSITFTTTTTNSHTITSSNGSFTNLKIGGTTATTGNLVTVNGNMTMNGYLDFVSTTASRYLFIGSNLLTFSSAATISNAGATTFIKTNGISSDLGVAKNWGASTTSFTYAVGTRTNYTPVLMGTTSGFTVSIPGNLTVVPVDAIHPTANPDGTQILDYYWRVSRDNNFAQSNNSGSLIFQVPTALIGGLSGTLAGYYLDALSMIGWTQGGTINTGVASLTFNSNLNNGNPVTSPASPPAVMPAANGEFDYTFGTSTNLLNPVAPVYSRFGTTSPTQTTTVGTAAGGSWSAAAGSNWTTSSTGYGSPYGTVPSGRPVVILGGATINLDAAGQTAFTTQINGGATPATQGVLVVSTAGNSLGTISGTGTLRTTTSSLPAGTYTTFTAAGGGTIEYANTMTMNSRTTYNNLLISSNYSTSTATTVTPTAANLTINGNFTISAGNTVDGSGNLAGQGGFAVAGNFVNAGTSTTGTSTLISVGGNMTNSGTFNASSSTLNLTGDLQNTGTFNGGTSTVNLAGNFSNSATFSAGTGTVSFNGTAAQTITGATTFNNLTINNTFVTSPQVTVASGNQTVGSTFTNTKGLLNLNSTTLTIGTACASPGAVSHSLVSSAGWVYGGSLTRYFNTTAILDGSLTGFFPVGTSVNFRPFFISVPSGDMTTCGTFTLSASAPTNTTVVSIADPTNTVSPIVLQNQGAWTVSSSVAGGTYNVTAGGTGFGTIGSLSDVTISKASLAVGTYVLATGSTSSPLMERTGLSLADITTNGGSQFYVGSTNASTSPLPIELVSFTGESKKYGVDLQWKTVSEMNNDYFTVSRSATGANFESIGTVKGNGTTNISHDYSLVDYKPILGKNYYQLKQTDFDNHVTTSETIVVNVLSLEPLISIYPNPLSQNQLLNVIINGLEITVPTEIQIVNVQGTIVKGATANTDSDGSLKTSLELTGLSAGLYILKVQNVHYKFIIE